jgi:hypothetical protein
MMTNSFKTNPDPPGRHIPLLTGFQVQVNVQETARGDARPPQLGRIGIFSFDWPGYLKNCWYFGGNRWAALIAIDFEDIFGQILAGDEAAPFAACIGDCQTPVTLALNPILSF